MFSSIVDSLFRPLGARLDKAKMEAFGIQKTMRMGRRYSRFQWGKYEDHRRALVDHQFEALLAENDGSRSSLKMEDGYLLDTSMSLPFLNELLEEGEQIIAQRSGRNERDDRYRSFFRNIVPPDALDQYPSLLKFVTSSAVTEIVSNYLGMIPCLSTWIPEGVRFVESGIEFDAESHLPPRDSQLYHIDPYCSPMVYLLVLMQDTTVENGPFTWMGEAASEKVKKARGYWQKGHGYRLTDDDVYSTVGREPEMTLTYPAGTVLFIDTSRCLHFGSRNCVEPRYQLMYGLMSPCRNDFSDTERKKIHYNFPENMSGSELRKLILNKEYLSS